MEKPKPPTTTIAKSLLNLSLNYSSSNPNSSTSSFHNSQVLSLKRTKPPSLVGLCIAVIGKHLEDLIPELGEIAIAFPAHIKMAIAAIARRRKLLNDEAIISLADGTWDILDISCSDVSDLGLAKVAEMCRHLRAVDIRGCPQSDYTARRCLSLFKPELNNVEGDSWEELDTIEITHGGHSLRWLVWPKIDPNSLENFSSECPRVKVNPQPPPFGFNGLAIPKEALPDIILDDHIVEDIEPSTWASCRPTTRILPPILSGPSELSMAEKFRLAFVERDTRLAPKRAKNARQHQRRAERDYMMMSAEAKAIALASRASKSLRGRN